MFPTVPMMDNRDFSLYTLHFFSYLCMFFGLHLLEKHVFYVFYVITTKLQLYETITFG